MYSKEKIQPNKVNAPVLFVGLGGIGSRIIKGVATLCANDDTSNMRFVVMDTDANSLIEVNTGANIVAVQTSSTSAVGDYLKNDKDAKENWFPENKMLDAKAVSEGAGQVRAISRLALNATIKQGNIIHLYKAIDELFLKDGGNLKQAIRVVIASTSAGGTGSGIAMEMGMLIRHYIKNNYPEAAVMIRGFLVMPGVMDTVIATRSEKESLRCNGYATIKEINAFMMKGSGFFDTVPELQRYKDLCISIPTSTDEAEYISNLPFDFCFLLDRTDSNAGNMITLSQYEAYASQSIYEQNIGPMRKKTASIEDNILKLCISPEKLGRCRFGGTGASVLKYPYEYIRDYIALNWTRASIIGTSNDEKLDEKDRKALLENSWLQFDAKYLQERKNWEDNPNRSVKNEPTLASVYVRTMEGGKESSGGNEFTAMLWDRYINPKLEAMPECEITKVSEDGEETIKMQGARNTKSLAEFYIYTIVDEIIRHRLTSEYPDISDNIANASRSTEGKGYKTKYQQIKQLENICMDERVAEIARNTAKEIFTSKSPIEKTDLGEYMLEKYLSINGKAIHPNAARHLLYELHDLMESDSAACKSGTNQEAFTNTINSILNGEKDERGRAIIDEFQVKGNFGKEKNLKAMCDACDKGANAEDSLKCDEHLKAYFDCVQYYYKNVIKSQVYEIAIPAIGNLIKAYEAFYSTFESKVPSIERAKEDIITKVSFRNGDCVKYLFGKKEYLDKLANSISRPSDSGEDAEKLYGKIFNAVRNNAYVEERKNINPFNHESKEDIFEDIIINYFKNSVENNCEIINTANILSAIKLEYNVKTSIELEEVAEELKDKKANELYSESSLAKYIRTTIQTCENLASPGIKKKDNEEPREINVISCNEALVDGDGIRVSDYLPNAVMSDTISKYELRFFRSVYNIMPTQLAKLSAPTEYGPDEELELTYSTDNMYEHSSAGYDFRIYQQYMDKIGPDCKTSAIITPHIDMRWNSISVMPELDMSYQKRLMRKIHKSMIYGFIYDRIVMYRTSDETPDAKVYKYLNNNNEDIELIVSNGSKCDILYEVLDALYFDRLAVSTIRDYVNDICEKNRVVGYQSYKESEFFQRVENFKYKDFLNDKKLKDSTEKISLFTIVLMYCNSLPVNDKDFSEMRTMVEAIIEIIHREMDICIADRNNLAVKAAAVVVEQYNRMLENFNSNKAIMKKGIFTENAIITIKNTILNFFKNRELDDIKAKMKDFEIE